MRCEVMLRRFRVRPDRSRPNNLTESNPGKAAAAFILCLILAACSSGGPSLPPYGGPTQTPPAPRPGAQTFALDLSQPTIGLGLAINGDVPPDASSLPPQYTYGTFDAPSINGHPCSDPAPDCYTVSNGVLHILSPGGGWPIITRQTFDGAVSFQVVAYATCLAPDCWGGPVAYNGDAIAGTNNMATGNWRGLYFSYASPGMVHVGVWGPTLVYLLPGQAFPEGAQVTLRIDYSNGVWTYCVNGLVAAIESDANPFMPDNRQLLNPPHAALFMGDLNMEVSAWDVWVGP